MRVEEVKACVPEAEVYEMTKGKAYLVLVKKPIRHEDIHELSRIIKASGINDAVIVAGVDIKLYKVEAEGVIEQADGFS